LVDFDGDGRLDLLSGSNCCDSTAFHLFRRKPDGSWAARQRLEITPAEKVQGMSPSFVSATDWNGDGVPDLLRPSAWGRGMVIALGPFKDGKPIVIAQHFDAGPDERVATFAIADWDRDGKFDLLVRLWKLAERKLLLEITPGNHIGGFCVSDWGNGPPSLIVTRQDLVPGPNGKDEWRGSIWHYPRE
jgi:hypothetical protein